MSDLHLGSYGCQAKEIVNYLKSISPQILILNGDVIDVWQFRKHYFPIEHIQVIKEVMSLAAKGTRVIYVTGNHDEAMRRYSDIEFGNFQLVDKVVMEINGKMCWIFHGDVFDTTTKGSAKMLAKLGSHGYNLLIRINRFMNWILQMMGKEKMSLSKNVMNRVNKAVTRINNFEQTAAEIAIEKKYDYVICGHIHEPQMRTVENKAGKVIYLNSGDWVEHLTALEFYNNDWHMYEHDEKKFIQAPVIKMEKSLPKLNVVTDDVAMFISSLAQPTEMINSKVAFTSAFPFN
jgi:UDP-2,3-diacylglucosamine pyrophosphatase LpxH